MVEIKCSDDVAQLISRALDIYTRLGLGQFWYITDCYSVKKRLWNQTPEINEEFRKQSEKLSNVFTGYTSNASFGIFHSEVGDDCKSTAHINQQIRHEFFLQKNTNDKMSVDAREADICRIAGIPDPIFKITIKEPKFEIFQFKKNEILKTMIIDRKNVRYDEFVKEKKKVFECELRNECFEWLEKNKIIDFFEIFIHEQQRD